MQSVGSIAIGNASRSLDQGATALGLAAISNGTAAMAVGSSSNASSDRATAVGPNAIAAGKTSLGVGSMLQRNRIRALQLDPNRMQVEKRGAIGSNSNAAANGSTAVGPNAIAAGTTSGRWIEFQRNRSSIAIGSNRMQVQQLRLQLVLVHSSELIP